MDDEWLTIGQVGTRSGIAPSALRFYEREGLIRARRSSGGTSAASTATSCAASPSSASPSASGSRLQEIRAALATLPTERTPDRRTGRGCHAPGSRASTSRSRPLERLRDRLTSCIGCGCLSF